MENEMEKVAEEYAIDHHGTAIHMVPERFETQKHFLAGAKHERERILAALVEARVGLAVYDQVESIIRGEHE